MIAYCSLKRMTSSPKRNIALNTIRGQNSRGEGETRSFRCVKAWAADRFNEHNGALRRTSHALAASVNSWNTDFRAAARPWKWKIFSFKNNEDEWKVDSPRIGNILFAFIYHGIVLFFLNYSGWLNYFILGTLRNIHCSSTFVGTVACNIALSDKWFSRHLCCRVSISREASCIIKD